MALQVETAVPRAPFAALANRPHRTLLSTRPSALRPSVGTDRVNIICRAQCKRQFLAPNKTQYSHIVIPTGVQSIQSGAFERCSHLKTVVLPEGVTTIGEGAFRCCTALERIELPQSLREIGAGAFQGCRHLRHLVIPASSALERIGPAAFRSSGLTTLTLGTNVKTVGARAFAHCEWLLDVHLPRSDITWEPTFDSVFQGCVRLHIVTTATPKLKPPSLPLAVESYHTHRHRPAQSHNTSALEPADSPPVLAESTEMGGGCDAGGSAAEQSGAADV